MNTDDELFAQARQVMVAEIAAEAALTVGYTGRVRFSPAVMEVMGRVPRHEFVPDLLRAYAYANRPLPIGASKTISQPYMVALMTDMLNPAGTDRVLEIGSGAGYQAAVLAELVDRVYTVELITVLAEGARARLRRLGYRNIDVHIGNGYYGWPEHAPYDKIVVTAACDLVPPPLIAQLKPRGRMVIPTGTAEHQTLTLVTKDSAGVISIRELLPVRFSELDDAADAAGMA
ncbi:MAG: protein-L-isoaspartate(D-aspartate) O-methyltransferase [Rhodospirillaceae bacterium]